MITIDVHQMPNVKNVQLRNAKYHKWQLSMYIKCQMSKMYNATKCKIFQMTTFNVHQMPNVKNVQHYQMQNISSDNY
jgi:hypothetical protein